MARQDFYVNGEKKLNGENKFRYVSLAWNAACRLLKESDAELLWIVALDKQRLKPGDIPDAIGKKNAECLAKGGQFEVNGKNVKFYTERTLPKVCENAIVLLIHPTTSLMTKADRIPICNALIVVPFFFKDVQQWIDLNKPTDILQSMSS
jgi:hypothetical protein